MGSVSQVAQGVVSQWQVAHSALSYLTFQVTTFFCLIFCWFLSVETIDSIYIKYFDFKYIYLFSKPVYLCACVFVCMGIHTRIRTCAHIYWIQN